MDQSLCWGNRSGRVGCQQFRRSLRFLGDIYRLQFDQSGMNFPIADAFKLGKLLLRCFNRPFSTGRRLNDDRALAAPEESFVSRNFIDKANAVARHLCPHPVGQKQSWLVGRPARMI
jgi:hypothetical protein